MRSKTDLHNLLETIEEQEKEIKELKSHWKESWQTKSKVQSENDKLKAQNAAIPKICKHYDGWSCQAYQSKEMGCPESCPNWEENTDTEYHNPADVEALKKAKEAIEPLKDRIAGRKAIDIIDEAIDKAIGGGQ